MTSTEPLEHPKRYILTSASIFSRANVLEPIWEQLCSSEILKAVEKEERA
jgi:hypothetical protein